MTTNDHKLGYSGNILPNGPLSVIDILISTFYDCTIVTNGYVIMKYISWLMFVGFCELLFTEFKLTMGGEQID